MPTHSIIVIALSACVLTYISTFALRRLTPKMGLVDIPNERSLHRTPTPRGGGLSFVVVGIGMTLIAKFSFKAAETPGVWAFLAGSGLVAAISLADDRWRLPILVRFSAHVIGALILLIGAGWIREVTLPGGIVFSLGIWGLPLTFIWIVGLTNAYNFMDGIDGLAAGQAVIAAATLAFLAQLQGKGFVALAMAIIAGSALGFLPHNWPPAKIFMGDIGSAFLGFAFGGWALLTNKSGSRSLPFFAWLVVMAPFVFDTIATLVSRIVRGQCWYKAHREHFYQRLIRGGWSHLAVTKLYLGLTAFLGLATIAFYGYSKISAILFTGMILIPLAGIALVVRWSEWRLK